MVTALQLFISTSKVPFHAENRSYKTGELKPLFEETPIRVRASKNKNPFIHRLSSSKTSTP